MGSVETSNASEDCSEHPELGRSLQNPMLQVYCAYALSSWGDRMWWFAGGILLKELEGSEYQSLKLTAIFTLVLSGSVVAFGALVGHWVDITSRLKALQVSLIVQNLMLVLCTAAVSCSLYWWTTICTSWGGWLLVTMHIVIVATAAISRTASVATTIILQKDWIVVLANDDNDKLARYNSTFRTIDLTAQILAPIFVGVVQEQASNLVSAIMIGVWNIISMLIEYSFYQNIYNSNAALSNQERIRKTRLSDSSETEESSDLKKPSATKKIFRSLTNYGEAWKSYFQHEVMLAGLCLAFLYMTVLGLDAITIAYGNMRVNSAVMGGAQGAAATLGVVGSLCFPLLRRRMGLENVGLLGVGSQIFCLVACVVSLWLPGSPFLASSFYPGFTPKDELADNRLESIVTFLAGIIFSRFGLWLADITITQIMQERIEESKRGAINGVQDSLNQSFDMLKSIFVIIFPYTQQFGGLVLLSFLFIVSGYVCYIFFYVRDKSCRRDETVDGGPNV